MINKISLRFKEGSCEEISAVKSHDVTEFRPCLQALDLGCRDKVGQTAFAAAMAFKNNKAAQSILQIDGKAAEQYDARGREAIQYDNMKILA